MPTRKPSRKNDPPKNPATGEKDSDRTVALFEGNSLGSGLRLLARTRDARLVKQVGRWFAKERRTQLLQLDPDGELEPDPEAQRKK